MESFEEFFKDTFGVSRLVRSHLTLMGCVITMHLDGLSTRSHKDKLEELNPQLLRDAVVDQKYQLATEEQAKIYRSIIGTMLFIERTSSPVVLMHASMAAAKISD